MTATVAAVLGALDEVVDPCSAAMGAPLGLAEMGLVHSLALHDTPEGAAVAITLAVTSPCCAYGPLLADAAEVRVRALVGVASVSVVVDYCAEWTPARLSGRAVELLEQRRTAVRTLTGVHPHDWAASR